MKKIFILNSNLCKKILYAVVEWLNIPLALYQMDLP